MKQLITTLGLLIAGSLLSTSVKAQAPAFPGAEGHARYAVKGGRGQSVYHVTNLNDSGSGSLRDAVSQDNRIIVFDVSGYIDLKSDLRIQKKNLTIAGQTAPGQGITVRYYTLNFSDANCDNIIVRFLRFRRSQIKDINDSADAAWGRKNTNIILDHCSFSWSIDEIASFYDNRNFTMQWCTVGEALANPGHSKGEHSYGGIWGGKEASFHHNFLCHMQNRVPRFNGARYKWDGWDKTKYTTTVDAERVDFRNCVMYNWGNGNGCYGGPGGGYVNIVNNYYQAGPGTVNKTRVTQISVADASNSGSNPFPGLASRYYIKGNYVAAASTPQDYDWNGVKYDNGLLDNGGYKWIPDPNHYYGSKADYKSISGKDYVRVQLDEPIVTGDVTTHTAVTAYEKVLAYAGASLVRDAVDARYAEEARTGTTTYTGEETNRKGIVDKIDGPTTTTPDAVHHPSFPDLVTEVRPAGFDTDRDGMPDDWEVANGLDPNNAADGKTYKLDERQYYTNVEVYLNSLVEHIVKAQNADALQSVEEYYPAYTRPAGLSAVSEDVSISHFEYYSLDGHRLEEPQPGFSLRRIVLTDGSVKTDVVLK